MAAQGITQEDVASAMDGLLEQGQEQSVRAVRKVLGTGSFSTISKYMAAVRLERSAPIPECEAPPHMGELLQTLTLEIWKAARASARLESEALRKAMHEKSYAVEASLEQVTDLLGGISSEMSGLHQCADSAEAETAQETRDDEGMNGHERPKRSRR